MFYKIIFNSDIYRVDFKNWNPSLVIPKPILFREIVNYTKNKYYSFFTIIVQIKLTNIYNIFIIFLKLNIINIEITRC